MIHSISSSTITDESTTIQSITDESITTQSVYQKAIIEMVKMENDLKRDQKQLKIDRKKLEEEKKLPKSIKKTDVIRLNVGGEVMMTTRETLIKVPKSTLSIMFNGRWEHKLQIDQNGNIFFDFNPILFRHLLDQLQALETNKFTPPSESSLVIPFKKMLRKLGFHQLLSEKNILTFNVGGQIITERKTTFTQLYKSSFDNIISFSNTTKFDKNSSEVFFDYNPKLFQHLINQLRSSSYRVCFSQPASYYEKIFYQEMLADFGICRRLIPSLRVNSLTKWKRNGITIAGGNKAGNQTNQLSFPQGIFVNDDDQSIYIADCSNHRIVEWKYGATNGQVVAGGNGNGNRTEQLTSPTDVIIDKKNDSLIICDYGNRRVVRWSLRNSTKGQIIISNIDCYGLAIDDNGDLYVSDGQRHEVRRYKIGHINGIIVAGGYFQGNNLNQLGTPHSIFVDQDYSIYVSDWNNHRVMKWVKGAKEGVVVADGQGKGSSLVQLNYPVAVIVDQLGNVYIADYHNYRIIRWSKGSEKGDIVVGGNRNGTDSNRLNKPVNLSFDRQGNLYVVDEESHRVQKFEMDSN